jgi:hypothetical protein
MATIRMALSAGAALIALMAFVPAASQAQSPKAPLQLVPQADQATTSTRTATTKKAAKTPGQATRSTASKKSSRQNAAAAQPSASKKATNSVASRRQGETATNAQSARAAVAQPTARADVAAPSAAVSRPVLRRAAAPQVLTHAPADNVMRGGDSISLIAKLPWWRNHRLQEVNYGSAEAENQVMAAADAWLAARGSDAATEGATGESFGLDSDEATSVADAGDVNDIDLAATSVPAPPTPTFLQSLFAILGGAVAAAAASARFLFA